MCEEVWKSIPGFEGHYEASDHGRVRSIDKMRRSGRGSSSYLHKGRVIVDRSHEFGYPVVTLSVNGKLFTRTVHSLVALAFIGERPAHLQVCHNDGDPKNSRLTNLRYDTAQGNNLDKLTHGTQVSGEENYNSRLTEENVVFIRNLRAKGYKLREIGEAYGLSESAVHNICTGMKWPHAPGPISNVSRTVNILKEDQRKQVIEDRRSGLSLKELARKYKVSVTQISNIVERDQ